MQTVTDQFQERAESNLRKPTQRVLMSFDKTFDDNIDFFTVGVSSVGGTDIIKGEGDVVQEWDKYEYAEYTDRVISVEWSRDQQSPYSANLGIADITFNNTDDFFNDVLPGRPIRIYAGFGSDLVQVFVGITEKVPEIDEREKTAKFHCIDFLQSLYNRPLEESVIYQDFRVDEVIGQLFESVGLLPTQYDFDVAFTTIPFAYFPKGTKLGDAVNKLVQADLGYLFLDENGVLTYRNRQNFSDVSVFDFDRGNTNDIKTVKDDGIINVVEVKSNIREVQASQKIWESSQAVSVPAGETVEIWAEFQDPATTVSDPTYTSVVTDAASEFTANLLASGGSAYSDIMLASHDVFSNSSKMTFENTGLSNAYITLVRLFGTPAKVVRELYIREQDDTSVTAYGERVLTIENDYVQDESTAQSLALVTLGIYATFGGAREIDVKGNPALQLRDPITLEGESYYVNKQQNSIQEGNYKQVLSVEKRTVLTYFTVGVSFVGSGDVIAP